MKSPEDAGSAPAAGLHGIEFTIWESLSSPAAARGSMLCLLGLIALLPQGWISGWSWEHRLRGFYLLLIAFFATVLLVPWSIYLSVRFRVLDMPAERKIHTAAMPRLGGLAVYGATLFTLLRNHQWSEPSIALLAAATVIYALGVCEDGHGVSATARLWGQLAACAIAISGGIRVGVFPDIPGRALLDAGLTAFWLIGITNAINFLDGIDGLAAGMSALCAALLFSVAGLQGQKDLVYAASALAGACLGFLPYNWRPARTFLGDAGSTFIGFMLAGLAVLASQGGPADITSFSTPLLILSIPIFDMVYTTLSRIRRGAVRTFKEWLEFTGRDHFHHRLMKLGLTAPQSVAFIVGLNLALGLAGICIHHACSPLVSVLLLLQALLIFAIVVVLMLLGRDLTPD